MAQYAEIVEIVAPSQAVSGSQVNVTARIKNTYPAAIGIMAIGIPEYPGLPGGEYINGLYPYQATVNTNAGWVAEFAGYFIMPSTNMTIRVYSYYFGSDGQWHFDDEKTKGVNLAELSPVFCEFRLTDYQKV